jgi:uncharacterized protein (TIGR03118 family)
MASPLNKPKGITMSLARTAALSATALALALAFAATPAGAETKFRITNLVSDGAVKAVTTDPNLVNPWGIATSSGSPFWINDNGAGVSTLYNTAGSKLGLTVTIPVPSGGTSAPTGMVFNSAPGASDFAIGGVKPAFIFDSEDGTISGWAGSFGTLAQTRLDNSATAVYKGLAIGTDSGGTSRLYAANFTGGAVEAYDTSYGSLPLSFTDPTLGAGYGPFDVQVLGGDLYVSYAKQSGGHDEVDGAGLGYVDVFTLDGTFLRRIASAGDPVNAPWGLAIAPASFREFAGDLLVGNFGDGTISAFDATTGTFKGKLEDVHGDPLFIDGLWGLLPGNGGSGGTKDKVYFTAGLNGESDGLFGSLTTVPEPGTWTLMLTGFGLLGAMLRRRSARGVSEAN